MVYIARKIFILLDYSNFYFTFRSPTTSKPTSTRLSTTIASKNPYYYYVDSNDDHGSAINISPQEVHAIVFAVLVGVSFRLQLLFFHFVRKEKCLDQDASNNAFKNENNIHDDSALHPFACFCRCLQRMFGNIVIHIDVMVQHLSQLTSISNIQSLYVVLLIASRLVLVIA
jgi:hypothetical protein